MLSLQLAYMLRASLITQLVKNPPAMQETPVQFLGQEDPWRRDRLPTPVFWPGEFHGLYSPWGCKESDMTERLSISLYCSTLKKIIMLRIHILFRMIVIISHTTLLS